MTERGSSLVEILVFGAGAILVVGQSLVGIARVSETAEMAAAAARAVATSAARTGADAAIVAAEWAPDGAEVEVTFDDAEVGVVVRVPVSVLGPIEVTVAGRAAAPISPYRSAP